METWKREITVTLATGQVQNFIEYTAGTVSIVGKAGVYPTEQFEAGLVKAKAAGATVVEHRNPMYRGA
jgi:hypothetical protein